MLERCALSRAAYRSSAVYTRQYRILLARVVDRVVDFAPFFGKLMEILLRCTLEKVQCSRGGIEKLIFFFLSFYIILS